MRPRSKTKRAGVLGEFGGLGLPVPGHTWQAEKNWGYRSYTTADELTDAYLALIKKLHPLTGRQGLSAAVYTQTTDVEVEVNGLMTYDRAMIKMDAARITAANNALYTPPEPRRSQGDKLIPPATPLVACDPYFSIWSPADNLTDEDTIHWTGKPHRLTSMVRIDGKPYRIMGTTPGKVPPLKQTSLTVLPTRTIYTFEGAGIALTLTFMTPALPDDIDVLSRPVTYLTYDCPRHRRQDSTRSQVYFDASAELAVNDAPKSAGRSGPRAEDRRPRRLQDRLEGPAHPRQERRRPPHRLGLPLPRCAARPNVVSCRVLPVAAQAAASGSSIARQSARRARQPPSPGGRRCDACAAIVLEGGQGVGKQPVSRWLMLAYDDLYSIQYMKKNLRPYWRRNGWEAADLLKAVRRRTTSR